MDRGETTTGPIAKTTPPAIHVRTWMGSGSVTITDMTNAGKAGKVCPVIRFSGWLPSGGEEQYRKTCNFTHGIIAWADAIDVATPYATAAAELKTRIETAKADGINHVDVYEETIRGINAPRPKLTHRAAKFTAEADESGITLDDLTDANNLPAMITIRQTPAAAYRIAAKTWDKLKTATTMHEAGRILTDAGARLHYYCRMD